MPSCPSNRKPRVCTQEACEPCRKARSKCDGKHPCSRCTLRGIECTYHTPIRRSKGSLRAEIDALKERQREQDAFLEALQDPLRKDLAMRVLQDRNCAGSAGGAESTRQDETAIEQNGTVHHSTADRSTGENVRAAYGNALQSSASSLTTRSLVAASPHMDAAPMESDAVVTSGDAGSFSLSSVAPGTVGQIAVSVQESQMPFLARYPIDTAFTSPYCPQYNYWTEEATNPKPTETCILSSPTMATTSCTDLPSYVGGNLQSSRENQPHHPVDNLPWTQPPAISGCSKASFPTSLTTTQPASPEHSRTHSEATISSSVSYMSSVHSSTTSTSIITYDLLSEGVPVEGSSAREPHRNPSTRSWHKQKNAIADLQATAYCAEAYSEALRQEHTQILSQVHDLHDALLKHVDCDDPAISMWLRHKREAMGGSGFGEIRSDGEVT